MSLWLLAVGLPLALLVYSAVHHDWAGALLCAVLIAVYSWLWTWGDPHRRRRGH